VRRKTPQEFAYEPLAALGLFSEELRKMFFCARRLPRLPVAGIIAKKVIGTVILMISSFKLLVCGQRPRESLKNSSSPVRVRSFGSW